MEANAQTHGSNRSSLYLGLAVFLVALIAVAVTLDDPGLAWDEPAYLSAGIKIMSHVSTWWSGDPSPVEDPWDRASAHPVVGKILVAGAIAAFNPILGDDFLAGRMVGALSYAGVAWLIFALLSRWLDKTAGLAGALAWMLCPRGFGHAHFVALDMPLAFFFFAAIVAFLSRKRPISTAILAGVLWGLALGVKVTAILLPVCLLPLLFLRGRDRSLLRLLLFLGVGVAVFLALFIPMWLDGPRQLLQYLTGGAVRAIEGQGPTRTAVPVFYMGRVFTGDVPWHYYPVMLVAVAPLSLVALALVGIVRSSRSLPPMLGRTLLAAAFVPLAASVLGPFPKYDGVRLILYMSPILACLAGVGAHACLMRFRTTARRGLVTGLVIAAFVFQIALFHPYELSYYSPAVGSLRGAARLGFEVTYWHETNDSHVFNFLNAHAPPDARIAFYPVGAAARSFYPAIYDLREDIAIVEIGASDTLDELRKKGISMLVLCNRRSILHGSALLTSLEAASPSHYNTVPFSGRKLTAVYRIE